MSCPKVSIIVPCWGVEKYLNRCVESLVNQTLRDIEIILIDDESPDLVPIMCDEWAKKDSRIKVIHKQNGGLGYARNSGLQISLGEYITFCDSDDYVDANMYYNLYALAIKYNADIVTSGINKEVQPEEWITEHSFDTLKIMNREESWQYAKNMIATMPNEKKERLGEISVCTSLFRNSIVFNNEIHFYSERKVASEDLLFKLDFYAFVNTMVYTPNCYYYYCLNGNSLTTKFNKEKFNGFVVLRDIIIEKIGDNEEAHLRANRFLLGCTRTYLSKLALNPIDNKIDIIRELLSNHIWKTLKKEYSPSFLPVAQRIFYRLQLLGKPSLLLIYTKMYSKLKSILGKKVFA